MATPPEITAAAEAVRAAIRERHNEQREASIRVWGHPGASVSNPPNLTIEDLCLIAIHAAEIERVK